MCVVLLKMASASDSLTFPEMASDSLPIIPVLEVESLTCSWARCGFKSSTFEEMYTHLSMFHLPSFQSVKFYECHWKNCTRNADTRFELAQHIQQAHLQNGNEDELLNKSNVEKIHLTKLKNKKLQDDIVQYKKEILGLDVENRLAPIEYQQKEEEVMYHQETACVLQAQNELSKDILGQKSLKRKRAFLDDS